MTFSRIRRSLRKWAMPPLLIGGIFLSLGQPGADADTDPMSQEDPCFVVLAGSDDAKIRLPVRKQDGLIQNDGTACFSRKADGAIQVQFRPDVGCRSSSCTQVLRAEFDVVHGLRDGRPALMMTSAFDVRAYTDRQICTADCGGGGHAVKELNDLDEGIYVVLLGDKVIGEIDTKALQGTDRRCLRG